MARRGRQLQIKTKTTLLCRVVWDERTSADSLPESYLTLAHYPPTTSLLLLFFPHLYFNHYSTDVKVIVSP